MFLTLSYFYSLIFILYIYICKLLNLLFNVSLRTLELSTISTKMEIIYPKDTVPNISWMNEVNAFIKYLSLRCIPLLVLGGFLRDKQ